MSWGLFHIQTLLCYWCNHLRLRLERRIQKRSHQQLIKLKYGKEGLLWYLHITNLLHALLSLLLFLK